MGVDSSFKYFYESPGMTLKVSPTSMTSLFSQLYFSRETETEREMNKRNCKDRGWVADPCLIPSKFWLWGEATRNYLLCPRGMEMGWEAFPRPPSQAIALTSTPASRSQLGGFFLKVRCVFLKYPISLYLITRSWGFFCFFFACLPC